MAAAGRWCRIGRLVHVGEMKLGGASTGCAGEIKSAGSRRADKGSRRGKQPEQTGYFHAATA